MHRRIEKVMTASAIAEVRRSLEAAEFIDGRDTASGAAAAVKRNMQLGANSPVRKALVQKVGAVIGADPTISALAFPKAMAPPTFARYEAGMSYGAHVDAPFLASGSIRADISMTLFLNDPDEYTGGELVLDMGGDEIAVKLPAGDAFIYPTSYLHRVAPVTFGTRLVAVTWFQSHIPDERNRQIVAQLREVRLALEDDPERRSEAETLRMATFNLLRQWWQP